PNAFDTTRVPLPGFYLNGLPLDIEQDLIGIRSTEVIPFKTQFDQFLGYGAGLSLSIPIYNNYSVRANRQRAKWTTRQSELQLELEEERLSQNIIQAMANFKASKKAYEAAVKAHEASAFAHEKTQKRFELGTANTFELNQSMTQLLNAESSRLVAKYDMVFKQKVLDYYAGKKIEL
ncbi:MAG TPA: TolC family protein, partial [Saprospiraceae bacterium]|nr:TolC family protein [Saprospiraceae bacterium]